MEVEAKKIVITPNSSLSRRGNQIFFLTMLVVMSSISLGFAFVGAWMILPFAGLELGVLAWALKANLRACRVREIVSVSGNNVCVEVGERSPEKSCSFVRAWTKVLLSPSAIKGHPSRLFLRSEGRQVELGACLDDSERRALSLRLEELISSR